MMARNGQSAGVDSLREEIARALDRIQTLMAEDGYRGYDPYDGLQSPLFRLPMLRTAKIPRWGFQQVLKRVPFQMRPLLGIPRGYNPVTLALALEGIACRHEAGDTDRNAIRTEAQRLVDELKALSTPGFSGTCWGYDFDWEAKYANIPARHPTIVATGIVVNGLFHAWKCFGLESAKELILGSVPFVLEDLNRTSEGDGFCWSYSPTDNQTVLNATMKGSRLLAQAVHLGADRSLIDLAKGSIRYVTARQAPNGSWPYSIGDDRTWADNFHTCYNLDCLDEFETLTGDATFRENKERGLDYYCANFFTDEGIPRYYDQETYPIDATCCGQSLLTLVRFGKLEQARKTAAWILDHMVRPDGAFKYQIHRRFENRLHYMRWSTCWNFAGLAALALALDQEAG